MNKLIEKDGRYYQECEVLMLAASESTNTDNSQLFLYPDGQLLKSPLGNQHIYFLSNEEIKEGDWFMNRQYMIEEGKEEYAIWRCGDITPNSNPKKIIATTDTSLFIESPINIQDIPTQYIEEDYQLPQPSQSFIQAYIKAYNEGISITKVLVEMEELNSQDYHAEIDYFGRTNIELEYELKVNSSNEITIKKIKDSYTREEVERLTYDAMKERGYTPYCIWQEWAK